MADAFRKIVSDRCRQWSDQPAGEGSARLGAPRLAQEETHDAVLGGSKREAPARRQVEKAGVAPDLGEHRGEAAAAEPFLEYPEGVGGRLHADDDEALRIETEAGETGAVRKPRFVCCGRFYDPQNPPMVFLFPSRADGAPRLFHDQSRQDRCGEAGHGGGVAALGAAHLVERGPGKAAAEHPVEAWDGKGKGVAGACFVRSAHRSSPLDLGDPAAKTGKGIPCHENAGAHGL